MQAFWVSMGVVAVSEIGDKTQLLALLLAARFRRPLPIVAGIVIATLVNHTIAGALGAWLGGALDQGILRWVLGALFVAMGLWALIPDKLEDSTKLKDAATGFGIVWVTVATFFLAEMGDKTQVATVALAARFHAVAPVVMGTTLGMLIADVPAVLLGQFAAASSRMGWVRYVAAAIFIVIGILTVATNLLPSF